MMTMNQDPRRVDLLQSKSNWSIRIKIARAIWSVFSIFLVWRGPRVFSPIRIAILRVFGARIGRHVLVLGGVKVWCPWNLSIGDFSAIGFDVEIYNFASVDIGEMVVVSQYVYICTASHHYDQPDMALYFKPIKVGAQSWVAARAFIAPGVVVGEGAVVGACSVVTKDVLPWTVVAGNPARNIRARLLRDN